MRQPLRKQALQFLVHHQRAGTVIHRLQGVMTFWRRQLFDQRDELRHVRTKIARQIGHRIGHFSLRHTAQELDQRAVTEFRVARKAGHPEFRALRRALPLALTQQNGDLQMRQ